MTTSEEQQTIEHILSGRTELFARFVDAYGDRVYALVRNLVGDTADADDVAQEVFVKAYTNLGRFHGGSSFQTWLLHIAYNSSVSHLRSKSRDTVDARSRQIDSVQEHLADQAPDDNSEEMCTALWQAVESLPPEDQALLRMFYFEDMTTAEIASIIGQNHNTIRSRLMRIRKQLHRELGVKNE